MFSLALNILYSTGIALILKQNEQKSGDILLLLSANYFMAAIIGLFFLSSRPQIIWAAILVYLIVNISVILLTAIAAAIFWREALNKAGIAALVAGSSAILLLV